MSRFFQYAAISPGRVSDNPVITLAKLAFLDCLLNYVGAIRQILRVVEAVHELLIFSIVRQEMTGELYLQADVWRASVLAKVEECGAGSQNQGCHVQQAGSHEGRCGIVQNMQGSCAF